MQLDTCTKSPLQYKRIIPQVIFELFDTMCVAIYHWNIFTPKLGKKTTRLIQTFLTLK